MIKIVMKTVMQMKMITHSSMLTDSGLLHYLSCSLEAKFSLAELIYARVLFMLTLN